MGSSVDKMIHCRTLFIRSVKYELRMCNANPKENQFVCYCDEIVSYKRFHCYHCDYKGYVVDNVDW